MGVLTFRPAAGEGHCTRIDLPEVFDQFIFARKNRAIMSYSSPINQPKRGRRISEIIGIGLGWLGFLFSIDTCYSAVHDQFRLAASIPPGSHPHLEIAGGALFMGAVVGTVVCGILAISSILLLGWRRRLPWILGAIGICLSIASLPLGARALNYVTARMHWVPT